MCEKAVLLCIHSTKDLKQSADEVYIISNDTNMTCQGKMTKIGSFDK